MTQPGRGRALKPVVIVALVAYVAYSLLRPAGTGAPMVIQLGLLCLFLGTLAVWLVLRWRAGRGRRP